MSNDWILTQLQICAANFKCRVVLWAFSSLDCSVSRSVHYLYPIFIGVAKKKRWGVTRAYNPPSLLHYTEHSQSKGRCSSKKVRLNNLGSEKQEIDPQLALVVLHSIPSAISKTTNACMSHRRRVRRFEPGRHRSSLSSNVHMWVIYCVKRHKAIGVR